MKKILSSAIALIMLLGCLSVTAFAKEATINVTGSYDPNGYARIISVDVVWGSMEFTFTSGSTWDPATHTSSGGGKWTASGNDITLTNHSSAEITATFGFISAISGLGGSFYDKEDEKLTQVTLATAMGTSPEEAPTTTVWFRMEAGVLTQDELNLGVIGVTIADTLSVIDATAMSADQLKAAITAAMEGSLASLTITLPEDADNTMQEAINTAIGTQTAVSLTLSGLEKTEYDWNENISVKYICSDHIMAEPDLDSDDPHLRTCTKCDYAVAYDHEWESGVCIICGTSCTHGNTASIQDNVCECGLGIASYTVQGGTATLVVPENVDDMTITTAIERIKSQSGLTQIIVKGNVTDAQHTTIKNGRNGRAVYFMNENTNNYISAAGNTYTCTLGSESDEKYVLIADVWRSVQDGYLSYSDAISSLEGQDPGARAISTSETAWSVYQSMVVSAERTDDMTNLLLGDKMRGYYKDSESAWFTGSWNGYWERRFYWFPVFDVPLS